MIGMKDMPMLLICRYGRNKKNRPLTTRIFIFFLLISGANFSLAQDSTFVLKEIAISGNKRTKPEIMYREIPVRKGDTVCCPYTLANTTFNRLTGLKLFNLVAVKIAGDTLFIQVTEKYYFWALPRLSWADRNFNVWLQTADPARLIYGATFYLNNIGGRNQSAYATLVSGYNQAMEFGYSFPFTKPNTGWGFSARAFYWTNHELWYKTMDNRLQFLHRDEGRIQQHIGAEITEKKLRNYFQRTEFTQGWNRIAIDSSAYLANPDYLLRDTMQHEFFGAIEHITDYRDRRDYPSKGSLWRVGAKLGVLNSRNTASSYTTLFARISHFQQLAKRSDLVWAKHLALRYTTGLLPYNYTRQLGYSMDYVRGYEPYVFDGYGFFLVKTGVRKALINNKTMQLWGGKTLKNYQKVPLSLWFNIFADIGHVIFPVETNNNNMADEWLAGTGAGLDLIVWYNAMLRAEYSFNRLGQGFFNLSYKNAF
jgi:outer membrane protein assembly factor BamA